MITMIPLERIINSQRNPRRSADQASFAELSASIAAVGVLQPIIVRQVMVKKVAKFEIVCGERRFRASILAGLKQIPSIIKELNDDLAFEMTITENLQREDIHPMDEAAAFLSLVKGKYTVADLVTRFWKNETYIRLRLKLNDLIEEFQQLLLDNDITITVALEVSKLSPDAQRFILVDLFDKENDNNWSCPSIKQTVRIITQNYTSKLSEVQFSLTDEKLNKDAGACIGCPHNSTSNMLLFPDSPETGICLNVKCLEDKKLHHFDNEIIRVIETEPQTILAMGNYLNQKERPFVDTLLNSNVKVLEFSYNTGYDKIDQPGRPEAPDPADFDDGVKDENYIEAIADFSEEVKTFETQMSDFNKEIADPAVVKVFMVAGNDKGEYSYFIPNGKKPVSSNPGSPAAALDESVKDLEAKKKRNGELEFQHIYEKIDEMLYKSDYAKLTRAITMQETKAFFLEIISRVNDVKFDEPLTIPTDKGIRAFRSWIRNKLHTTYPVNDRPHADLFIAISMENYPEKTQAIIDKVKASYVKRNAGIDLRIAEVKQNKGIVA